MLGIPRLMLTPQCDRELSWGGENAKFVSSISPGNLPGDWQSRRLWSINLMAI